MDHANPVETKVTYRLHRAEYLVGLAVVTGLLIANIGQVRWLPAVVLFVYIDLIGYIPGAIAYRRSPDHHVAKGYYIAYNTMHSLITQAVVAGIWMWVAGPEWALLVLPFHLFIDRGVFGNFLKPFSLAFEPEPNPAYVRLSAELLHTRPAAESTGTVPAGAAAGR
ncbi:hypothetical protein ACFO3J_08920 [Streptomyces polygonati]|uniref:Integral membrane protein n=1 Tax=Streptomyces polygonati TaxID=1617087 RepID=A0ABV8HHR7_9ACTN